MDIGDHRLDSSNELQENNLPPDGTPVPRSSSTPNRLEIFIDENWIIDREDIENELYDVNLNGSVTDLNWSETKDENNNVCEGKGKELRRSQGLLNQNPETGLNKSTGESVIPVALKKESGNSAAFQNEFSYFISNRNEQTLASCTLNKDKLSDVKEATSNIDLVDTRTLVKNGDQLIKPDFRPLVQIKTELYDDVSDDDAPNLDVFKAKAEPVEEIHNPLASDKWREYKAIDENAKLTHETNISSNDANISNTCKETPETVNKDTAIPKRKRVGRKTKTPKRSPKKCDPKFKGATVWFQTEYRRGRSRLNISAFYR